MSTDYGLHLESILQELTTSTPQTRAKLEALRRDFDVIAAFYAAFLLLTLQIRVDAEGPGILDTLSYQDVQGYTYVEYTQARPDAWKRLEDILRCFCAELQASCYGLDASA